MNTARCLYAEGRRVSWNRIANELLKLLVSPEKEPLADRLDGIWTQSQKNIISNASQPILVLLFRSEGYYWINLGCAPRR
jgi:hypothetical protein